MLCFQSLESHRANFITCKIINVFAMLPVVLTVFRYLLIKRVPPHKVYEFTNNRSRYASVVETVSCGNPLFILIRHARIRQRRRKNNFIIQSYHHGDREQNSLIEHNHMMIENKTKTKQICLFHRLLY